MRLASSFFFLMIRRPPRSTLFPYTNALPICGLDRRAQNMAVPLERRGGSERRTVADRRSWTERRRATRSEEHTSELQSRSDLVCRLLLEKKKKSLYTNRTEQ